MRIWLVKSGLRKAGVLSSDFIIDSDVELMLYIAKIYRKPLAFAGFINITNLSQRVLVDSWSLPILKPIAQIVTYMP